RQCKNRRVLHNTAEAGSAPALLSLAAPRPLDVGKGHRDSGHHLKSSTKNNGEGSPLTPVGLSGLVESRHAGCPGMKLFMLHEQLVCRISVNVLLKYTKVLVPSFVWPCLVASKVQGRFGSLSIGIVRMVPLVRPLGN